VNDNGKPAGRIVVGLDGSPGSSRALRFALDEARLRCFALEAVLAWHMPAMLDAAGVPDDFDPQGWAQATLDATVAAVSTEGVTVDAHAVQGPPASVLLDATKNADLLVVGSRGHGGFVGALLGSVSQHCVAHATCPVVVVPVHQTAPHSADE
jgi:nucleotide-binding universal stress UspA family protein